MVYAPQKEFRDSTERDRFYGEMWTSDWWWTIQQLLPPGVTVIPVILASDKTCLTIIAGSKQAYPVYLTIGNIPSDLRRQESSRTTIVLAYLPVTKLAGYSKSQRQLLLQELFHQSMAHVLKPLELAGQHGVEMEGADGMIRTTHPIYATHLADYQEQVQIACVKGCRCPMCQATRERIGALERHAPRDTLETAHAIRTGSDSNLNSVTLPFWERLPFVRLQSLFAPDILHQLLKGMFKDHLFSWCLEVINNSIEVDRRFKCLPRYPGLRHFRNGVTRISQWTGNEFRAMVRVILGVVFQAPNMTSDALTAIRAFLDFLYTSGYDYHDNASLEAMENSLRKFHSLKEEFGSAVPTNSWMIPKLHSMSHYAELSKALGAPVHFTTDQSEHMHIRAAKIPYRKSNRGRSFPKQMVQRLEMSERIAEQNDYFQWRSERESDCVAGDTSDSASEDGDSIYTDASDEGKISTKDDDSDSDTEYNEVAATYLFPIRPTIPNISLARVIQEYGAPDLLRQLQLYYLRSSDNPAARQRVVGYELPPLSFLTVDLYKQFRVNLDAPPYNPKTKLCLTIKADPKGGEAIRGRKKPYHSVVLVDENRTNNNRRGINGYRCATVRAILKIPGKGGVGEHLVAYIEWFTRFGAQPHEETGMYRVKKSYQTGGRGRECAIVDVFDIRRPCHPIPVFGEKVAENWRSWNVLELNEEFFISTFSDQGMYQNVY
ncbi:hypothetical protein BDV93DRAFT_452224 [Ceratobasidium sp. AG-I]|nr:hypothetical protein BDV93DRAFT_452224 [Ceratobasidium sp. AG-I]